MKVLNNKEKKNNIVICNHCESKLEFTKNDVIRVKDSFGIEYEEQAISEITLSLMEDSGWYKMNYYTGGLMRFGKNKGCAFLDEDCEVNEISNNKFKKYRSISLS